MGVGHAEALDRVAARSRTRSARPARLPTTQPSWPGSIATICGARCSITQPSAYSMWISPDARKPTCACMHRSVPTTGFMSTDQRNPGWIDHPLDPRGPGPAHFEPHVADLAALRTRNRREQRPPAPGSGPRAASSRRASSPWLLRRGAPRRRPGGCLAAPSRAPPCAHLACPGMLARPLSWAVCFPAIVAPDAEHGAAIVRHALTGDIVTRDLNVGRLGRESPTSVDW